MLFRLINIIIVNIIFYATIFVQDSICFKNIYVVCFGKVINFRSQVICKKFHYTKVKIGIEIVVCFHNIQK